MNKTNAGPMDFCNLIAHETAALLYDADGDALNSASELRAGLAAYANVCGLGDEVSAHLAWIDSEMEGARCYADTHEDTPHLLDPDQLLRVPDAAMQVELIWGLFRAAVRARDAAARKTMLELARTITDMCGLADMLPHGKESGSHVAAYEDFKMELDEVRSALTRV